MTYNKSMKDGKGHGFLRKSKAVKGLASGIALAGAVVAFGGTSVAHAEEATVSSPEATADAEGVATVDTVVTDVVEQPVVAPVEEAPAPVVADAEATDDNTASEEVKKVKEEADEVKSESVVNAPEVTNAEGRDISNEISLKAKFTNKSTKAEADAVAEAPDVIDSTFGYFFADIVLKSDTGGNTGDTFTIKSVLPEGTFYFPEIMTDENGEVFARRIENRVETPSFVGENDITLSTHVHKYELVKDVDRFGYEYHHYFWRELYVMNKDDYPAYPMRKKVSVSIGDSKHEQDSLVHLGSRFTGIQNQASMGYDGATGKVYRGENTWLSELSEGVLGRGIPETTYRLTIPEGSPFLFNVEHIRDNALKYNTTRVLKHELRGGDNGDIRVDRNSVPEEETPNYIEFVSATPTEVIYKVKEKPAGSTPVSIHINPSLLIVNTDDVTAEMTREKFREKYKDRGLTNLEFTTENNELLSSSGLSSVYNRVTFSTEYGSHLLGGNAEIKRLPIANKNPDGTYTHLQVKDIDTKELVPVSEYEFKPDLLPQIAGTSLRTSDMFNRLDGAYTAVNEFTTIEDPMTTVWVRTQKFDTTLNAILENGTVIKENMASTGLLKTGSEFTLNADETIEYEGKIYTPQDGLLEVTGRTGDKPQVLTKVYILSPKHNHEFVDLTVSHVDTETGAVLKTTTTPNNEETTTYTTSAETFPEYNLVETPDNANGTFGKDPVTVTYKYMHKKGTVTAKFTKEDGSNIKDPSVIANNVNTGEAYISTHPNEIEADGTVYRWVSTDGAENGTVTEGDTIVNHKYVLVKGNLIEKYVDLNGAEIKPSNKVLTDAPVKTAYSLEYPNEIEANGTVYRWVSTDGKTTGQLVEGDNVTTYKYDTVKGSVTVIVVDGDGNNIFPPKPIVTDQPIGKTTYDVTPFDKSTITGEDGKTYRKIGVDGGLTGKVTEGNTNVSFKYEEVKTSVTVKIKSTTGETIRPDETMGDLSTGVSYDVTEKAPLVIYGTDKNVYKRTAVPANAMGKTAVEPTVVTFVYEKQTAEPKKAIASENGNDLTGKVLLAGDKVVYKFSTSLEKFKGVDGVAKEDKEHAVVVIEDIDDKALSVDLSKASVSSADGFLNHYESLEKAPESIKEILTAKKVKVDGGFVVLTSFNPLASAEDIKAQNAKFFANYVSKGINISVVMPTNIKAGVDNVKIENKITQIDFDGVTESPVLVNNTPDINPTKDVIDAKTGMSAKGDFIMVGDFATYKLEGNVYPANRGSKLKSYQQVDKYPETVEPTGIFKAESTADIKFEDGYVLGDDITIPAKTEVKGSWITPVDIVSDKDGSVIKAGTAVSKGADSKYVIEKDLMVKAGTVLTNIVLPKGTDFTGLFRNHLDTEKRVSTFSLRQDAFEKVSADSAFGFTVHMQVKQIKAGMTSNTYTEVVNGVETNSDTVTHEGIVPVLPPIGEEDGDVIEGGVEIKEETPKKDGEDKGKDGDKETPAKPEAPATPAQAPQAKSSMLPETGDAGSLVSLGMSLISGVGLLALAGRKRED